MKTTQKDFEYFKERCNFWSKELGVNSKIFFQWIDIDGENVFADCAVSPKDGAGVIRFCKIWDRHVPKTDEKINAVAFHEVLHLMFGRLYQLASNRNWDEEMWETAEHSIIRGLEQAVL